MSDESLLSTPKVLQCPKTTVSDAPMSKVPEWLMFHKPWKTLAQAAPSDQKQCFLEFADVLLSSMFKNVNVSQFLMF